MTADQAPRIDEFSPADLDQGLALYNHYVRTSTATFQLEPLDREAFAAMVFCDDPRHRTFAIRVGDAFVGYCLLGSYKSRCAYRNAAEVAVYLAPGWTGRGLGAPALAVLERHARRHGLQTLLAGVCTENDASVKLFRREGYAACAHFKRVGLKFGRVLDVAYYQKLLDGDGEPS